MNDEIKPCPSNDRLQELFDKIENERTVAYAHGVLRGILVNSAQASPTEAFLRIIRTKVLLEDFKDDVDVIVEDLFTLGDHIVLSYINDKKIPNGWKDLKHVTLKKNVEEIVDLCDGFYTGLSKAPIPIKANISATDQSVKLVVQTCEKAIDILASWDDWFSKNEKEANAIVQKMREDVDSGIVNLGRQVAPFIDLSLEVKKKMGVAMH